MATKSQLLTTGEFANQAGISSSKVTTLIRNGKIKAEKKSGKWMISSSELKAAMALSKKGKSVSKKKPSKSAPQKTTTAKKTSPTKKATPAGGMASAAKAYTLEQFVKMTYLTENGVKDWLRQGRLSGRQNETGEWMIDASNLDAPYMKRLMR
jgi:excisionase family DNA binding protein